MLSFHVKFVQTDRRTDNGKTICLRSFDSGGIKKESVVITDVLILFIFSMLLLIIYLRVIVCCREMS